MGQHGSWNGNSFSGYRAIYIPFESGAPAGKPRDVVTGGLAGDQARGRPVGLGDGTGALLVAGDAGNMVWRTAAADGESRRTDNVTLREQFGLEPSACFETVSSLRMQRSRPRPAKYARP